MTQILVVGESLAQLDRTCAVLESAGYEVGVERTAHLALQRLETERFDLVLSDAALPGRSGFELCRAIRANTTLRGLPVILLTAPECCDVMAGLRCGADSFMVKPVDADHLIARVVDHIATHEARSSSGDDPEARIAVEGKELHLGPGSEPRPGYLLSSLNGLVSALKRERHRQSRAAAERRRSEREKSERSVPGVSGRAGEVGPDRFHHLLETVRAIPWEARSGEGITYIGPQVTELLGYEVEQCLAPGFWEELVHPEDQRRVTETQSYTTGRSFEVEYRIRDRDGRTRWMRDLVTWARRPDEGKVLQGFMVDITELKAAEAAAQESQRFLSSVLDALDARIAVLDPEGGVVASNGRWRRFGGGDGLADPLDGLGDDYLRACLESDDPTALKFGRMIAQVREGQAARHSLEYPCDGREGPHWFSATVTRFEGDGPGQVVVALRDVSALRQAQAALRESEDRLRHAQKMEAIGRLAGGVAHDFNNMLTAINGYSDLMLDRLEEGSRVWRNASQVRKAGAQAQELTKQLLAFSRKQILSPRILNVDVVVEELFPVLRSLLGESVELELDLQGAGLGSVHADPSQLQQVVLNLVINAKDAMPNGGRVIVRTRNAIVDEEEATRRPCFVAGTYVLLTVSDTGKGVPEEIREHIFEPFFTTKPRGEGTGLGLSTVYGIVKQSSGWIWLDDGEGQGASFLTYLPRLA